MSHLLHLSNSCHYSTCWLQSAVYLDISLKVDSTEPKLIKAYCYSLSFMFQTHLILHISTVCFHAHSHKVSGSMGSRYGVAVRGTLLARDFYTLGRK
jgi:hypothetical protein